MPPDFLEDRATFYVSGAMPAPERESFAILLESDDQLRAHVEHLQEVAAELARAVVPAIPAPSSGLKARILANLGPQAPKAAPDALVVTGPDRCIRWVNQAFTDMCGYTLNELRGRPPGAVLQGAGTDPEATARIHAALVANTSCRETLVNYHKNGSAYSVDVSIAPILDDAGAPWCFVARERKLADLTAAV